MRLHSAAKPDGVVASCLHRLIPLLLLDAEGAKKVPHRNSPPVEGRCLVQIHWGDCIASAPGGEGLTGWLHHVCTG